jgi:hypothetical protein
MKDISAPFSLYDFFAVMLPGAVGLFGIYLFLNPSLTQVGHDAIFSAVIFKQFTSDLALITSVVLLSYLLGLVLNALSELLIDRPANRILYAHINRDMEHHNVKKAILKKFGKDILKQSTRRTFIMVETTVGTHIPEAAARASKFIALAVMFQSLTLALLIIVAALVRGSTIGMIFHGSFIGSVISMVVLFLVLISLTLWSYRRYKRMWSQTIFMSFVAWVNLEFGNEGDTSHKGPS